MTTTRLRETAVAVGAAAAFVLTAFDLEQHYDGAAGAALAFAVARALLIVLAWLRPLPAVAASLVLGLVNALVSTPVSDAESWPWPVTSIGCHLAVLVLLGVRYRGRPDVRVVLAAAWVGTQLVSGVALLARPDQGNVGDLVPPAVLSAAAVLIAGLVRSRAATRAELTRQVAITADEQASRLRTEERARIARELHDVVAHHLSVVVVRADSAHRRLPGLPADAAAEFTAIADDARSSLEQMRRVLRLLRDDTTASGAAPQPGAGDIDELVAGARDAGADITLTGHPPIDHLDATVGLAAYRVVQEALSNAMRHAPGVPVAVRFEQAGGRFVLTVTNPARATAAGSGLGLRGMRERVAGVGGQLRVDHGDGTFTVIATMPLRNLAQTPSEAST